MPVTPSRSKKNAPTRALPLSVDSSAAGDRALALFHPITAKWFRAVFDAPTAPQVEGWPAIAHGESTLILAPTGTGKTLTAFLWCLDKLMLQPAHPSDKNKNVARVGHPADEGLTPPRLFEGTPAG